MKNIKYSAFILFFIFGTAVLAQTKFLPGFVVLNNGDTLRGEILNQPNSVLAKECLLKRNEQEVKYSPMDLISYGITESNRLFKSQIIAHERLRDTLFLEYLVDGIVDLYYAQLEKEWYFIEKDAQLIPLVEDEKRTIIKDNVSYIQTLDVYKGSLNVTFEGVIPQSDLGTLTYGYKSLSKITTDYHNAVCDWECTLYRKNTKLTVDIIPTFNTARSTFRMAGGDGSSSEFYLSYGVTAKFQSFRTEFLSFIVGAEYMNSASYAGKFYSKILRRDRSEDYISLKHKLISIPMYVRWELKEKNRISFFLQGGMNNHILVQGNYFTDFRGGGTLEDISYQKYLIGFCISPGLTYQLSKSLGFQLASYYERVAPFKGTGDYFDYVRFNNFGLSTGLVLY